jgi:hypothetical protein
MLSGLLCFWKILMSVDVWFLVIAGWRGDGGALIQFDDLAPSDVRGLFDGYLLNMVDSLNFNFEFVSCHYFTLESFC